MAESFDKTSSFYPELEDTDVSSVPEKCEDLANEKVEEIAPRNDLVNPIPSSEADYFINFINAANNCAIERPYNSSSEAVSNLDFSKEGVAIDELCSFDAREMEENIVKKDDTSNTICQELSKTSDFEENRMTSNDDFLTEDLHEICSKESEDCCSSKAVLNLNHLKEDEVIDEVNEYEIDVSPTSGKGSTSGLKKMPYFQMPKPTFDEFIIDTTNGLSLNKTEICHGGKFGPQSKLPSNITFDIQKPDSKIDQFKNKFKKQMLNVCSSSSACNSGISDKGPNREKMKNYKEELKKQIDDGKICEFSSYRQSSSAFQDKSSDEFSDLEETERNCSKDLKLIPSTELEESESESLADNESKFESIIKKKSKRCQRLEDSSDDETFEHDIIEVLNKNESFSPDKAFDEFLQRNAATCEEILTSKDYICEIHRGSKTAPWMTEEMLPNTFDITVMDTSNTICRYCDPRPDLFPGCVKDWLVKDHMAPKDFKTDDYLEICSRNSEGELRRHELNVTPPWKPPTEEVLSSELNYSEGRKNSPRNSLCHYKDLPEISDFAEFDEPPVTPIDPIFLTQDVEEICSGKFKDPLSESVSQEDSGTLEKVTEYAKGFFDDEAELSGEEVVSDDESENEQDYFEDGKMIEDNDLPADEELREGITDLYMKEIMNDDFKLVELAKRKFYDEDASSTTDRKKKFKWSNTEASISANFSDDDSNEDDIDNEMSSLNQDKTKWQIENEKVEDSISSDMQTKPVMKIQIVGKEERSSIKMDKYCTPREKSSNKKKRNSYTLPFIFMTKEESEEFIKKLPYTVAGD